MKYSTTVNEATVVSEHHSSMQYMGDLKATISTTYSFGGDSTQTRSRKGRAAAAAECESRQAPPTNKANETNIKKTVHAP
jgi:hypothetical protein